MQLALNWTGLPDGLKAGVEALSGISMNHVRLHDNSGKPAQLNAHAYAPGHPTAPGLAPEGPERRTVARQHSRVVQRDVKPLGSSGRWYTHLDIGEDEQRSFATKTQAEVYEEGLEPEITLEMLDHAVDPPDANGIVNVESNGHTGRYNDRYHYAESPCMTFFDNAITREGRFIFKSNYRQATPKTKFYASQVAEKQWDLAQAAFGDHPPAGLTKITRQNVENSETKEVMKQAQDAGVEGDALVNVFLNTTPNGKSTRHLLDFLGYKATSIAVANAGHSESDSNCCCNTMALKSMDIVPLRVPQTAARRRDISLTLAM